MGYSRLRLGSAAIAVMWWRPPSVMAEVGGRGHGGKYFNIEVICSGRTVCGLPTARRAGRLKEASGARDGI